MSISSFIELLALGAIGFSLLPLTVSTINLFTARRISKRKLQNTTSSIAILIPARNEEENIGTLLEDLQSQSINNFAVFVLDDHSEDSTPDILKEAGKQMQNLTILKGNALPSGWLGKPWACQQLADASADYETLIFIDADVRLGKYAIESALQLQSETDADLLTSFPTQITKSVGEAFFVTLVNWVLLTMLPLRAVEKFKHPSLSAANGQFMLFNRNAYQQIGQHSAVKTRNTEDIELSFLIQQAKLNLVVSLGASQIYCRMYSSSKEALNGISRSYYIGFGAKGPGFVMTHLLAWYIYVMPVLLMATSPLWIYPIAITLATRTIVALQSNRNIINDLLIHLFQTFGMIGLAIHSFYKYKTNSVVWKGRNISISAH